MDLGDFTNTSLGFPSGFVLDASVLDEDRDVVPAVLSDDPAKMIYVGFKRIRASRGELEAETGLHFILEAVKAHTINRVLQASVLRRGSEFNHVDVHQLFSPFDYG